MFRQPALLRTLYARLAAVLCAVLVAVGLAYAIISDSITRDYQQVLTQRFNRDLAERILADRNLVEAGRLNEESLRDTFHMYMQINPSIEIYLLDLDGRLLAFSADPGKVKRERVALAPIHAFLAGADFPLLGDDPRAPERRKAFSVTPVPSAAAPEGYLYVVLRGEEFDALARMEASGYLLRLSATAVAASLGFGLLAGLALFFALTRRLRRLDGVMQAFADSGFTSHRPAAGGDRGGDEIERLGRTFDQMAARIESQLQRLARQDAQRRDLVAQVSHDLRTPLASLHGYLETVQMKGAALPANTRREYLEIALRQAARLTRLVEELFELARLEAGQMPPQRESFSLAELVQDVAQKHRVNADQAGIELAMTPPAGALAAAGDIALTERVLDNLIGNAIEHTPANGRVSLSVAARGGFVEVCVTDSGPGIDARDLPHIFEPYYRSAVTGNGDGHAGLGLAICKRIVELQGGELRAGAAPGRGAEFRFTLPA